MQEYWSNVYAGDEPNTVRVGAGKATRREDLWRYTSVEDAPIYAIHIKLKEASK